jgi:hypothetical protein
MANEELDNQDHKAVNPKWHRAEDEDVQMKEV